jgi:hypothetical protein
MSNKTDDRLTFLIDVPIPEPSHSKHEIPQRVNRRHRNNRHPPIYIVRPRQERPLRSQPKVGQVVVYPKLERRWADHFVATWPTEQEVYVTF